MTPLLKESQTLTSKGEEVVKDLVQRGYVKISDALCGPLAIKTGERMASLTEAGREALGTPCEVCGDTECDPARGLCGTAGRLCECADILAARRDFAEN